MHSIVQDAIENSLASIEKLLAAYDGSVLGERDEK
jgi:hypothetical protein